jgi:hypothetical protein
MAFLGFGRRREPSDDAARQRIVAWTRQAIGLPEETVVKVNEILCPDPACPGLETIVLVMPKGRRTRAFKVGKPMAEVSRADVAAALIGEA